MVGGSRFPCATTLFSPVFRNSSSCIYHYFFSQFLVGTATSERTQEQERMQRAMAIRSLSHPFSPLPSPNLTMIRNKILLLKAPKMLSISSHGSFDARERANREVRSLGRVKVSAEKDLLTRDAEDTDYGVVNLHHVGILCESLERSLGFYKDLLGLQINEARPHDKLPYRGAWLWIGSEMIHLMELPNPDPLAGRPEHGGRDRHTCIAIKDVSKLKAIFDRAGISYTLSRSGRPAIFARDPDGNALEFTQVD